MASGHHDSESSCWKAQVIWRRREPPGAGDRAQFRRGLLSAGRRRSDELAGARVTLIALVERRRALRMTRSRRPGSELLLAATALELTSLLSIAV